MNRRTAIVALASAAALSMVRVRADNPTIIPGTPTPAPTPEDPGLCTDPRQRKQLIRMRIANLRTEIAALREALRACD